MKKLSLLGALLLSVLTTALAQLPTARVQLLHNSPTPTVDVYVNGVKSFDDFAFRTATTFLDLPAGIPLSVGLAASNSQSSADILETFPVQFESGKTYVVTASGVIFNPDTPLSLITDGEAKETASASNKVAVSILHGSPGAPPVDVSIRTGNKVVSNLAYGQFTPYVELPNADYFMDVKVAGTSTIVATYRVDLTPHGGKAIKVFASGFLGNDPAFGLYGAFADGTVTAFPLGPVCRVQVINNSPNTTLDFFKNGARIYDDLEFRKAQPFTFVPADLFFNVGVGNANTASVADTFYNTTYTFQNGKDYIITLNGIVGSSTTPFNVNINETGREFVSDTNKVEIAVLHGSPGAPAVDVDAVFVANNVVQNLAYGQFTPYLGLNPDKYDFAVRPAGNATVVASYRADLSGLKGKTAYVFASGLLTGSPSFGLYAALADGNVIALPTTPYTKVQVIHNSPPPTVDVYAGNTLLLNDFAFRTATPFLDVPADRNIAIGVAPAASQSVAEAIASFPVNFAINKNYVVYAAGVVGNATTPFTLVVNDAALTSTAAGFVAFNVMHGVTDAGSIDVAERFTGNLIENLAYGQVSSPYTLVSPDDYFLDIKPAGVNQILETYLAPLGNLSGQVLHVFASGYFAGSPSFGLFAALTDGTVIELQTARIARVQIIHNSPSPTVDLYAFDELFLDDFEFRTATEFITVPADVAIPFVVAPGNSQSVADGIATIPYTFENNKTYIVVASGIVGSPTTPFKFIVKEGAREESIDPASFEITILHGVPNAPSVDLITYPDGAPILSGLEYEDFTDYLGIDPGDLFFEVETSASPKAGVGIFGGDLSGADGLACTVFASGILGGDPGLEMMLTFADGFTVPFPSYSRVQIIHNAPEPSVDAYYVDADFPEGIQVLDNFEFRTATGWGLLPAGYPYSLAIAPANSSDASEAIYTKDLNLKTGTAYTVMAGGVVGSPTTPFELYVDDAARFRAQVPTNVDVNLFHGAPDAPGVDVKLPTGTVIFDNVNFGEFAPYISVPPASYVIQLTPANDNTQVIQTYGAPLGGFAGQALTVFASGFLTGGQTPGFEVWAATGDGETFPLPIISDVDNVEPIQGVTLTPNPVSDLLTVRLEAMEADELRYSVRDLQGRTIQEGNWGNVAQGQFNERIDVSTLPSGLYQLELRTVQSSQTFKFVVGR
jgi:hypothetical protein